MAQDNSQPVVGRTAGQTSPLIIVAVFAALAIGLFLLLNSRRVHVQGASLVTPMSGQSAAAGGAYAGNKVEANMKSTKAWVVRVHMENGDERSIEMDRDPGLISGDLVRVSGNSISRR